MHPGMLADQPLIDRETAITLLRAAVPHWDGLLQIIEEDGGHLAWRPEVSALIGRLNLDGYVHLYEKPAAIGLFLITTLLGEEGAKEFDEQARAGSPEVRGAMMLDAMRELEAFAEGVDFEPTPEMAAKREAEWSALTPDEQAAETTAAQHLFACIFAQFFDHLAVMVHGEKLSSLVAKAKAGDDQAFLKAIQIDKRILTELPYFKDRFHRAHTEGDTRFAAAIGRRQAAPPYVGKLTHKKVWLSFAVLESMWLLDRLTGPQLLDLLTEAGVIDDANPIDDVTNLNKLRAKYRRFQKSGGKSTP